MLAVATLLACSAPAPVPAADLALPDAVVAAWPSPVAELRPVEVAFPADFGVHKVAVDPGHGAGANTGATTCRCEREADHLLPTALALAEGLEATGHFEVLVTRTTADGPSYADRLRAIEAFGAEVVIGVHEDVRGEITTWSPAPGQQCPRGNGQLGFAVLFSDRVDARTVPRRERLARTVARRLAELGLPPYDGAHYGDLYDGDEVAGVFRDRRGLQMLRRPIAPAIVVETHHALDPAEHARWSESSTRSAFVDAMTAALVDHLR